MNLVPKVLSCPGRERRQIGDDPGNEVVNCVKHKTSLRINIKGWLNNTAYAGKETARVFPV